MPTLRDYSDIPRIPASLLLKMILSPRGARVNMSGGLDEQFRACGPIVRQAPRPFKFLNLFGPDANRLVLMDRDGIFSAQKPWTAIMGRIFPNGLLLKDGAEHKHHRKIMHEAFKRPVLRDYADAMNPRVAEATAGWRERGEHIQAFPAFKELTLNLAAAVFVGTDLGPETRRMNSAFEDMVAASMSRIRLPIARLEFGRGLEGREWMLGFLRGMLEKKRADGGPDMFSRLCRAESQDGDSFSDQDIQDHMVFLMMAAHDTTTSTLTSLMYELAANPQWQERIREESFALGEEAPGAEALAELTTLTRAMFETLRLYPPLPVIPRIATAEFEFDGYRIGAGTMCVVSPIHTHRMEDWWTEPHRFDPDRFAPERAEHERHTHVWVPFGGGPHMCIGRRFAEMQVRMVMHHLVRSYRWSVPDGYVMPVQEAPISKPMDGLPIQLTPLAGGGIG